MLEKLLGKDNEHYKNNEAQWGVEGGGVNLRLSEETIQGYTAARYRGI